ncbi:MAG TPA: polysaccharide biosynthesis/export family protein [Terracidiphilus sp.]|nr:polysaccharide biosynthesis/export family protein [Terracidiphilus sp.]
MTSRSVVLIALLTSGLTCSAQSVDVGKASASTSVPRPVPDQRSSTYVIGPSDVITVTVWKQPNLSGPLVVRPDGMISMPLLGDVPASGSTPPRLAGMIAARLTRYFRDPDVAVELTQINSKKIYLLGEVQKPGPVDMTPGMTLLQAIASAGGPTEYANTRKIYVLRNGGGTQEKMRVHYKDALKGSTDANLVLQSGDTIVVP